MLSFCLGGVVVHYRINNDFYLSIALLTLNLVGCGIDRDSGVGNGRQVGDEFGNHLGLSLGQELQLLRFLLLDPVNCLLYT